MTTQVHTQFAAQFKRWFGDSKAVDAAGTPLIVYHGTFFDFDSFESVDEKDCGHPSSHLGIFFSDNPAVANGFAGYFGSTVTVSPSDAGGNVIPVYLSIQNPARMTWAQFRRDFVSRAELDPDEVIERAIDLRLSLIADGHDGIVVAASKTSELFEARGDQWVAFRPEQIKSAIGNCGRYNPRSQSILS